MLASVLLVAGCGQQTATVVYDSKKALLAADEIALAYLQQPPCIGAAQLTCVDPTIKASIKAASAKVTAARHAITAAVAIGQAADTVALDTAIAEFVAATAPFASLVK